MRTKRIILSNYCIPRTRVVHELIAKASGIIVLLYAALHFPFLELESSDTDFVDLSFIVYQNHTAYSSVEFFKFCLVRTCCRSVEI